MSFCAYHKGGTAVTGDGCVPWSVVDATELPPLGEMAKGARKVLREDHQTQSKLPFVGHHQPYQEFSYWHTAKLFKG